MNRVTWRKRGMPGAVARAVAVSRRAVAVSAALVEKFDIEPFSDFAAK